MKKLFYFSVIGLVFSLLTFYATAQWTQKANFLGGNRSHATSFSIGTKGYVSCGYNGVSSYYNDLWEYNPSTNAWAQRANLGGVARIWPTSFSIGSKGYVGLGLSATSVYLNDFWEYNPATNSWVPKTNFAGGARQSAVGFAIGSKGYVGTGNLSTTLYKDFWEYDPSTNAWTPKLNFGGTARNAAVGFTVGSKGYIGTGVDVSGFKNDFWEYDPSTNVWTPKANVGGPGRRLAVGFGAGGKGYLGTGQATGNIVKKDFWEYHPATNTWIQKSDVLGPTRANGIGFSIGSKGYVGLGLQTYSSTIPMNDFYEYDPALTPILIMGSLGATSYCGGTVITVPYSSSGITFNSGNVFTVQLSNASGSFTSPTSIGTLTSTAASGNINATIPNVSGNGYRIRVRSSNPAYISTDNGNNITITPFPSPASYIYIESQSCLGGSDWEAIFRSSPQVAGITYLWSENGGAYEIGGTAYGIAHYTDPSITLNVKYQNACGTSAPLSGPAIFYTPCGSFRMVISPNPAKETINLIIEERETIKSPKTNKTPFKATISLYNENNILVRRLNSNSKRITINRGGLFPGTYIVQVIIGTKKLSNQIIIE